MQVISQALHMEFLSDQGETLTIKVNKPAQTATGPVVSAAMDTVVANAVIGEGTTLTKTKAFFKIRQKAVVALA